MKFLYQRRQHILVAFLISHVIEQRRSPKQLINKNPLFLILIDPDAVYVNLWPAPTKYVALLIKIKQNTS